MSAHNEKVVNKRVTAALVNWLNLLKAAQKPLNTLQDTKDGLVFIKLIVDFHNSHNDEPVDVILAKEPELALDTASRYNYITGMFLNVLGISRGIDFNAARDGSEFELAKISLMLLINNVRHDVKSYAESVDLMENDDNDIINNFYAIMNNKNLLIHNLPVKFYEDFLTITETKRKSIVVKNSSSSQRSSSAAFTRLICSPMSKASIQSPSSQRHQRIVKEDNHALEKNRLEKEILKKDFEINQLQDEAKDKDEQIHKLKTELDECRRKVVSSKNYEHKKAECDSLHEELMNVNAEKQALSERCCKQQAELKELRTLKEANERLENKLKFVEAELIHLESASKQQHTEIHHLRSCEARLTQANKDCESKEKNILGLIAANRELEQNYSLKSKELTMLKFEAKENLDAELFRNAELNGEINILRQQFRNLEEESQQTKEDLQKKIDEINENLTQTSELYEASRTEAANEKLTLTSQITALTESKLSAELNALTLTNTLRQSETKLESALKKQCELSAAVKAGEERINMLQSEIEDKKKTLDAKVQLIGQQEHELNRVRAELKVREERLQTVSAELAYKSRDFENLGKYLNEEKKLKQEEICAYIDELEGVKKEMHEIQMHFKDELNTKESILLKNYEKINEMADEFAKLDSTFKALNEDHNNLQTKYESKCDEITNLLATKDKLTEELNQVQLTFNALNVDHNNLQIKYESKCDEIKILADEFAKLDSTFKALNVDHNNLQTKYELNCDEITNLLATKDKLTVELNQAQMTFNALNVDHNNLQSKYESKCDEIKILSKQLLDLESNYNTVKNDQISLQSKYESQCIEITAILSNKEQLTQKFFQLDSNFNALLGNHKDLQSNFDSICADNLELKTQQTKCNNELKDKLDQISSLHSLIESLAAKSSKTDLFLEHNTREREKLLSQLEASKLENEKLNSRLKEASLSIDSSGKKYAEIIELMNAKKTELANLNVAFEEKKKQLDMIQKHCTSLENELNQIKIRYNNDLISFEVDRNSLVDNLNNANQKTAQIEISLNQALISQTNQIRSECQETINKLQAQYEQLQKQLKETEFRIDRLTKDDKRNCDEIRRQLIEVEDLKLQVKKAEEREKLMTNNLKHEADKLRTANSLIENEKKLSSKCLIDMNDLKNKLKDTELVAQQNRQYGEEMKSHYETKKKMYEEKVAQLTESNQTLSNRLKEANRDVECLKEKILQSDTRVRHLVEEQNCLKNKNNTLQFQLDNMTRLKEASVKQFNSTMMAAGSSRDLKNTFNLNTPKKHFVDDTNFKFTSPEFQSDQIFDHHQDTSRRSTIEVFSRSSNTSSAATAASTSGGMSMTNSSVMPIVATQLTRFNTISENEFEAVNQEHKSFHLEPTGNINRLSTLQIRNQQLKPHLQSSYALEMNLPTSDEAQIRGLQQQHQPIHQILKDKNSSLQIPSVAIVKGGDVTSKRKIDEQEQDQNSNPKKTNMAGSLYKQSKI